MSYDQHAPEHALVHRPMADAFAPFAESPRAILAARPPTDRYTRGSAHARMLAYEVSRLGLDREVGDLVGLDDREAAAQRLERIGRTREGQRVRRCGTPTLEQFKRCRSKFCPSCSRSIEGRNRRRAVPIVERMTDPQAIVLRVAWCPLLELRSAVTKAWTSLRVLGRRRLMKGASLVAAIHPRLAPDGRGWAVHLHGVIDGAVVDAGAVVEAWGGIVGRRSAEGAPLLPAPARDVRDRREQVVGYATRVTSWCPRPGTTSAEAFLALHDGLFNKRLFAVWKGANAPEGASAR